MSRKRKKSKSGGVRAAPSAAPAASSSAGGGGSLMRLRGGMQGLVHGKKSNKPKTMFDKIWDVLFWILLAAAVGFFFYSKFFRSAR
jgi:hypothetical protein